MTHEIVKVIREIYKTNNFIPLHEPRFDHLEKKYLLQTIESGFVSSAGKQVTEFENRIKKYIGVKHAIAVTNGTSALHVALGSIGANQNTEVITQSLTFVATCNAISYCNASPVFVDVSKDTMGMCPVSLSNFLEEKCEVRDDGKCWNKLTNKKIVACVPMHTYGFPVALDELKKVCSKFMIPIIEDAAESLGSLYKNKHAGTIGKISTLSFNGNKIITTGGGGMILTNDDLLSNKMRHITTTAKIKHEWLFEHDVVGYNYRLPNLNASLGLAQLEKIDLFVKNKRQIAKIYQDWGSNKYKFFTEPSNTRSNYWLNVIISNDVNERNYLLKVTNDSKIMTRPAWTPMHKLKMFNSYYCHDLKNTMWYFDRIVNLPSSVNLDIL